MYESIYTLSKQYPLSTICSALGVHKASYLYWLNHEKDDDTSARLYQRIISIYADSNGVYGAPKIRALLERLYGISISTPTVSRAMHTLGIKSIVRTKFPYKKSRITDEEKKKIINLIKDLEITHLNQVWTTDVTYIQTINDGTFYLITYIDYYSKKVVAWDLCDDQKTDKLINILKKAIESRHPTPGLIVHSDKGTQMRSKNYRSFLSKHNLVFSYTSLNHSCDENAAQESFHSLLKKERLYLKSLYTKEDAYREIYNYIEGFYNPIRIHSSIGYYSPIEFENMIQEGNTPSK